MNCCAHCEGADRFFDEKGARKELKRFRNKGPQSATRVVIDQLLPHIEEGSTLLDIGGGIGVIQMELLDAGVATCTDVDASSGYQTVALELARKEGKQERTRYVHGDFLDHAEHVPMHDIVTLDKVICCYPEMVQLVASSAQKCRRYYALVYPRDTWMAKIFVSFGALALRLLRISFRPYIHATIEVDAVLASEGFAPVVRVKRFFWQVQVWERRAPSPDK